MLKLNWLSEDYDYPHWTATVLCTRVTVDTFGTWHINEREAEGVAEKKYLAFSIQRMAECVKGHKFLNCNKCEKFGWNENPNRNQYLVKRENVYMTRKNLIF